MSLLCTREFTLKVNGPALPAPIAYWKCDELASPLVDVISGLQFSTSGSSPGPFASSAGKIGTGVDTYEWLGVATPSDDTFKFLTSDFTIRCWMNLDYNPPFSGDGKSAVIECNRVDESWQLHISKSGSTVGPGWFVWDSVGSGHSVSPNAALTPGWHRIVCWVQRNVEIGMMLDNGSWTGTTPFTTIYNPPDGNMWLSDFSAGAGSPHNLLDEIAIWNRILTPAELLADWNGGAGRTYP